MPKTWVKERHRDFYYRKAKKEKFRSRAAYKLLQTAKRYSFIKTGDVVVDLGAAPGGWTQAARKLVGNRGFVLGIDIKDIEPIASSNVHAITGDITDPETGKTIRKLLPRPADAVISDVSPNVSGIWELDHARQINLADKSLKIATSILRLRGSFFVKVFHGDMLEEFVEEVKQHFTTVRMIKPPASRKKSSEIYVLGIGFRKITEQSFACVKRD